jgi:hypothetical protein
MSKLKLIFDKADKEFQQVVMDCALFLAEVIKKLHEFTND